MTRAEKRRLHRALNPRVPGTMRLLRVMTESGLMTVSRAQGLLDCETQSARNCLCKLVRSGQVAVETTRGPGRAALYRITAAGRNAVAEFDREHSVVVDDDEADQAAEEAERGAARAMVETNMAWARVMVPKSVFDLGSSPARARAFGEAA